MAKYEHEAKVVLEVVGGKENIQSLTHCMTRLRLVLNDASKVDKTQIAALTAIKGTAFQSGQFQIIIGNDVKAFYETLQDLLGERRVSDQGALKDQLMRSIGDVFAPLIPAIISGGLMLGLADLVGAQLGTLFHLLGTTIFTYLPVGIVYGVVQKLGGTPILGIVLGLVLCLEKIGYAGSVMVAILAGLALGLIEKGLRKICPDSISMLLVPLLSLVISCALVLAGLGPLGSWLDSTLSRGLYLLLISPAGLLVSFVLGVGYVCLVMTGMHHLTLPLDLIFISGYGYTMLCPLLALCNIAQASSALGMYVLQYKDARIRKQNREACISCYLGGERTRFIWNQSEISLSALCWHDWVRSRLFAGQWVASESFECRYRWVSWYLFYRGCRLAALSNLYECGSGITDCTDFSYRTHKEV